MVDIIRDIRQYLWAARRERTPGETSVVAIVGDRRRNAYSAWRVIVALVVAVFFVLAAVDAARQLSGRMMELDGEIQALQLQLESEPALDPLGVREQIEALSAQRLTIHNIGWGKLAASAGVYTVALVLCACFWHDCLGAFGARIPLHVSVAAHVLGHVGKYVPGKAMVVLLRVSAVGRHAGVGRIPAALAVFIETLTLMASGATLAGLAILMLPAETWLRLLAGALAVLAVIPTLPPLFRLVLARLARTRFGRGADFSATAFDWSLMLRGWLWTGAAWLMFGLAFWLIVLATPGVGEGAEGWSGYLTAAATIALAMVAGFLSLIPGGAGVRELVIIALLAPLSGTGPALAAAVLARLVFLLTETATSGITWGILRWTEPVESEEGIDYNSSTVAH